MEAVAVVGFAARLPQDACSAESFWRMLEEGRSARTVIPEERFNIDAFYHPDAERPDTTNARYGHFLSEDVGLFDAPFFSIQPSEAQSMDPQQRLVLEVSYHALENAGIPIESVAGSNTSVFVGSSARDYESMLLKDADRPAKYIATGIGTAMLANRVSWFFDLKGTSVALDTACSSSLSALHLACQSLRGHESNMSLVGGSNLIIAPDVSLVHLSSMGFFSPDGICYTFDHRANGYAKGEGVGMVVLKRFADAVRDGDTIRAVIRATGSNQDGRTPGITQPSKDAQADNIRATYEAAGLDMDTTAFFEAHGTGTQIGDFLEGSAIHQAFQRTPDNPLYVGALKPNIGHLESASGVAALIKSCLVLEHGIIPPNIWFEKLNENLPFDEWNIKLPLRPTPWPKSGLRRLSLNSFGYGGSNVHAVLEDAHHYCHSRNILAFHRTVRDATSQQEVAVDTGTLTACGSLTSLSQTRPRLMLFSTADEAGLERMRDAYYDHFSSMKVQSQNREAMLLDRLAFTLNARRSRLPWKSHLVVNSLADMREKLGGRFNRCSRSSTEPKAMFVFTGQGAQYYQMGKGLLGYPIFSSSLARGDQVLRSLGCSWSLQEEILKDAVSTDIHTPAKSQPACTALQLALVDLLQSWDIRPAAVVGHSSGEIAAAYCSGALSFESSIKIAYFRGLLSTRLEKSGSTDGAMCAVSLSEADILPHLQKAVEVVGAGHLEIGCVNSPNNVTITGDRSCIETLKRNMDDEKVFARILAVGVPYHSCYMQTVAPEYGDCLGDLHASSDCVETPPCQISLFSSVTGALVTDTELCQPGYWVSNLVSKVNFLPAITNMLSSAPSTTSDSLIILEIGPHSALQRPVKDIVRSMNKEKHCIYEAFLSRTDATASYSLEVLGRLCGYNLPMNLSAVNQLDLSKREISHLTDLPQYPFNHTQRHWQESRISTNYRHRAHRRHELLGARAADWNPLRPMWRNVIRHSEHPWLKDHVIHGNVSYPPAGLIVMAIEGAREVANPDRQIHSYELQNVCFERNLLIPETPDEIETQLYLSPHTTSAFSQGSGGSEEHGFSICAWDGENWLEYCRGTISVKYAKDSSGSAGSSVLSTQGGLITGFKESKASCREIIEPSSYYQNLADSGIELGPTFQKLRQIRYTNSKIACGSIDVDDWRKGIESLHMAPYVIHPTDLETVFQIGLVAANDGGWKATTEVHASSFARLTISNSMSSQGAEISLQLVGRVLSRYMQHTKSSVLAFDHLQNPVISIEGLRNISRGSSRASYRDAEAHRLCYSFQWKPDISILDSESLSAIMLAAGPPTDMPPAIEVEWQELICLHYVFEAKQTLNYQAIVNAPLHLKRYCSWMDHVFDDDKYRHLLRSFPAFADSNTREAFEAAFAQRSPTAALMIETGKSLLPILRGEQDGLDLLFSRGLAESFYHNDCFQVSYRQIASYLDLLAHKQPDLKILEIGAGTGAATVPVINMLSFENAEVGTSRFSNYTYTDISPAFLEKAGDKFRLHRSRMSFRTLDIEQEPEQQGFRAGGFDVVIACLVLHATSNLDKTLGHVHKLLKPGGKLILFEPTSPASCRTGFSFGLVPGWWLSVEPARQWSPLLCDQDWDRTLKKNGFTGNQIRIPDYPDETHHTQSVIISTAHDLSPKPADPPHSRIILVANRTSAYQQELAESLKRSLEEAQYVCSILDMSQIQVPEKGSYVFLIETEITFLGSICSTDFETLKRITDAATHLLWVTAGNGLQARSPELGIVTGFGRNVLSEKLHTSFVELALETSSSVLSVARRILDVLSVEVDGEISSLQDSEFVERGGMLHVPRLVQDNILNKFVHQRLGYQQPRVQRLPSYSSLSISNPGQSDAFHFVENGWSNFNWVDSQIEIAVKAATVNSRDVAIARGDMAAARFGVECAGVVTRAAPGAAVEVGDRVCCLSPDGALSSTVRVDSLLATKLPPSVSFAEASALPLAFCTAFYALETIGKVGRGDSVLIHGNLDGVGWAAMQVAILLGVHATVTVSSEDEKSFLMTHFDVPGNNVLVGTTDSLFAEMKARRYSFDIVLNASSHQIELLAADLTAPLGCFVSTSPVRNHTESSFTSALNAKGARFAVADLPLLLGKHPRVATKIVHPAMQLLSAQCLRSNLGSTVQTFKLQDVADAFSHASLTDKSITNSKAVLEFDEKDQVPVVQSAKPSYRFDKDATYVIAGGLGGLGRCIASWMVENGARYLLLLSRSGPRESAATSMISELRAQGVQVETPPCDVSDETRVAALFQEYARRMPGIKGCVQASMVLQEGILENLTHEDWHASLRPKVQGSWNLHKHLPRQLDFFVMLSSVAGVTGSRSQSNYAAANTYQDALARHRTSLGLKATSLNLGAIMGVGFAAEMKLSDMLKREGFLGMRKAELLALLEFFCDPALPVLPPSESERSQVVTGLGYLAQIPADRAGEIYWARKPLFSVLRQMNADKTGDASEDPSSSAVDHEAVLRSASSDKEAVEIVLQAITDKLSRLLGIPAADIDPAQPIYTCGIDSLVALEIRYWFTKEIKADVPVKEIMSPESLYYLAELAAGRSAVRTRK